MKKTTNENFNTMKWIKNKTKIFSKNWNISANQVNTQYISITSNISKLAKSYILHRRQMKKLSAH